MGDLFETHQDKALAMATRYVSAAGVSDADKPAYMNAALIGLWKAELSFKLDRVGQFWTYAAYRVAGFLRDMAREINSRKNSFKKKFVTFTDLGLNRRPSDGCHPAYIEPEDLIVDKRTHPDPAEVFARQDEVRIAMREYPPRTRRILKLYFVEERSMREIGKRLGLGESRVCGILQEFVKGKHHASAKPSRKVQRHGEGLQRQPRRGEEDAAVRSDVGYQCPVGQGYQDHARGAREYVHYCIPAAVCGGQGYGRDCPVGEQNSIADEHVRLGRQEAVGAGCDEAEGRGCLDHG